MAGDYIAVPNDFVPNTKAKSAEVDANFAAIQDALDGTSVKDLWSGSLFGNSNSVSDANYTILDNDKYLFILVTTGASDRTITLPTLADNLNRLIFAVKVDSGAGNVIIDGEGSETLNGATTLTMEAQGDVIGIYGVSGDWKTPVRSMLATTSAPGALEQKNKWQRKDLSGDESSTNSSIAELNFSNLVIGKTYRLTIQAYLQIVGNTTSESVELTFTNNSVALISRRIRFEFSSGAAFDATDPFQSVAGGSVIFVAGATTIVASCDISGSASVRDTGTGTWAILEELGSYENVSDF